VRRPADAGDALDVGIGMDNRTKGIVCIVFSAFGFALMAMFVRLCDDFGGPVSCFQKSFFRNLIALAIAATVFCRRQRTGFVRFDSLLWLRATVGTVGIFANFYALSHIPIGVGQTLNKTAPFFTVLLTWFFLRERMTVRQFAAILLAFAGAVLIIRPGFAGAQAFPLLMGLVGGIAAGAAYACVRGLAVRRIDPAFIVLFFSGFSCLAALPFMLHSFDPMTGRQLLVMLGAGAGGALGQFGITSAYRYARPNEIAVFDYTNIFFTVALGFLCFGQIPDVLSAVGMCLIVLAAFRV